MRGIVALAVLCALSPASDAAAAKWTEVRTPHFLLIGDARAGDMRRVAQRFEQFHAVMQRVLSRTAVSSAVPTVIVVFSNADAFQPYMPLYEGKRVEVGGIFWGGRDVNYVAINADLGEHNYPTIFHELTHLITHNVLRQPPLWFLEGIAEYYSTFDMRSPTQVFLGRPIADHVGLLRDQFIPLPELLAADERTRFYNEGNRRSIFYAESWALVHYLRGNEKTRSRFGDFLRRADEGVPQEQALKEAFGVDVPGLEKSLRNYVRQFRVPGEVWTLADPVKDSDLTSTDLPEAVALTHLGRLLVRMRRFDEAERRLDAALKANPHLALARVSVAQLRLAQDRLGDAWPHLSADVRPADFLEHYLKAVAIFDYIEVAGSETDLGRAALPLLREHSDAAVAARDDVAEAWELSSRAALLADDPMKAMTANARALALAPARENYRFTAANILVRQREFARARSLLGELMARGRTPDIRAAARRFMATLVTYERSLQPVEEPEADPAPPDAARPERPDAAGAERPGELIPVFRSVEAGETRVFGTLTGIECTKDAVTLLVDVDGRPMRVTTADFKRMEFIAYRTDLKGQITCGARKPPDQVFVTWRGVAAGNAIRSEMVVVEFPPKGFVPP